MLLGRLKTTILNLFTVVTLSISIVISQLLVSRCVVQPERPSRWSKPKKTLHSSIITIVFQKPSQGCRNFSYLIKKVGRRLTENSQIPDRLDQRFWFFRFVSPVNNISQSILLKSSSFWNHHLFFLTLLPVPGCFSRLVFLPSSLRCLFTIPFQR